MLRELLGLGMILETKAFAKGRRAYQDGLGEDANPFEASAAMRSDWAMGWRAARRTAAANTNRELAEAHPGVSAFELGQAARAQGLSGAANPYHLGHPGHEAWRTGWAAAKAS